jgi:hypothetical protein
MDMPHRISEAPTPEQIAEFSRAAQKYFEDMTDPCTRRFTLRYTEYLQSKAHGIATTEPAGENGVSMLDCRLIRNVLRSLYKQSIAS